MHDVTEQKTNTWYKSTQALVTAINTYSMFGMVY